MFEGKHYINGEFLTHRADFVSINPSTEDIIGHFPNGSYDIVNRAVESASKAFKTWRKVSRIQRAEYFDRLCDIMKKKMMSLVHSISLETGKSLNESQAEVVEAIHMVQYTFGMGRMPVGDVVASEIAEKDSYVIRKPKGVVAVITPWNFPLAICFWCSAPALLEGNTVVFKPSEDTPMVGQLIAELYHEAGFPPGTFNLVHGGYESPHPGHMLATSAEVKHICFTGSVETGQIIRQICATAHGKSCSCEMGSKSAVIVFDDADYDLALSACVASAYKLSGQRCVSSGRMLIHHKIFDKFCADFVDASKRVKIGDPFIDNNIFYGPLINRTQMERVLEFNNSTKGTTEVLLEGTRMDHVGFFLTPHVYRTDWSNRYSFLTKEVFGPHVALVPFNDIDDAIRIYNDTAYGLSVGVVTSDFKKARQCRDELDFGMGYWNSGSVAAESHLPFSGTKASGSGGGSAAASFKTTTDEVTWTVNHGPLAFPQGLK